MKLGLLLEGLGVDYSAFRRLSPHDAKAASLGAAAAAAAAAAALLRRRRSHPSADALETRRKLEKGGLGSKICSSGRFRPTAAQPLFFATKRQKHERKMFRCIGGRNGSGGIGKEGEETGSSVHRSAEQSRW